MTYITKNHIILAIMNCKRKYFNEEYVTYEELNLISIELQKRFNKENISALIDNSPIDENYFELKEVITLPKHLSKTIKQYQNITNMEVIKILLDEAFILNILLKISKEKIANAENKRTTNQKNLLLEYKNKLNNLKSKKLIDEKSIQNDLEFYNNLRDYYKFLTEDLYNVLSMAVKNTNETNMNNPFIEFKYEPEQPEDIIKRTMLLNFVDKYYLGIKKEIYVTAKGTTILKISSSLKSLLDAYYLELERLEYIYNKEELGITR